MKINTITYYIKDAFKSLKRNKTISIASVITVLITFFVLGIFVLLANNINKGIDSVQNKIDLKIVLKEDIKLIDQREIEIRLKEIEGVDEIRDESNKKGLRIVIQCEKGTAPEAIVKKLFAKTNLQTSVSYNQVALVDKTPVELNLKQCIKIYLEHNIKCLIKEINFDLDKMKARLHIVAGLLIALEDIDNVIDLIKKSASSEAAREKLMEKYKVDEIQAKSILAMRLSRLAKLEKVELEA